ncbi:hypothetical protein G6F70_002652 [Rhizopus microsporus]|uniref:cAMP-independent regulatory protein pac2 n=2 Tax=Rhizopus TaxID=4842 RepID=A0A367K2C9_RHIAZ|nr:hypothetical protein G6F71_005757 [Rhizopus microsporus]RCH96320.1 hypothetical protein CU097_013726 [Rhizopus azygosporus]KAG1202000.1 hypothetical protein G6F70_002652 [Rhizopus microsporus]KAG1210048.1 hypothetical protein G6F69_005829 [Rhizopus microsporus]ORE15504.1 hypothetical protein BCV71DRAFT_228661 [Rhizopus microsporus]
METFTGYIKTPQDALIIFEACRKGLLQRVKRRLTSKERTEIRSGSVFAWDEREAGMRRWTDGRTWSPSRVLGSFLTYRELDTKRRPRKPSMAIPGMKQVVFSYKPNGLIKQSFSICTASNQKLHLISYYKKADIISGHLKRPSDDPLLNKLEIPKGQYPEINPLDIGGGHTASIHSLQHYNPTRQSSTDSSIISASPSLTSSPWSSDEEYYYNNNNNNTNELQEPELISFPPIRSLPAQDVAWEKLPWSEDHRQLSALYHELRI